MRAQCKTCPFHTRGPGRELRRTLRPGRWREILASLRLGQPFHCHMTTKGGSTTRGASFCRGSIEYQRRWFARPDAGARVARMVTRLLSARCGAGASSWPV